MVNQRKLIFFLTLTHVRTDLIRKSKYMSKYYETLNKIVVNFD